MRMRARSASGLLDALGLGYDLPVGQAVYAIDAFPDDDLLWRIEWIGDVGYNTSVPSEPQIDVCLAQLPKGEKNPLSARARSSQVEKRTVKIGVGLLPYVWIGSLWQKRRPVITNLSAYRGRVSIDATSLRMVALGMATSRDNAIPRSSYLFGASWPNVCRTLLVAVEQDGDPYAVMVPTAEIIRFYYGPSTPSNSTARKQFERSGHRSCNTQLSWGAAPSILQQTTFNHSGFCVIRK